MPTLLTHQHIPLAIDGPKEAHVPAEAFTHRLQYATGRLVQVRCLGESLGYGKSGITVLFGPDPFAYIP